MKSSRRVNDISLTARRSFDVAARHWSFQDAAAELGETVAAISHSVRSLESSWACRCSIGRTGRCARPPDGLARSKELAVGRCARRRLSIASKRLAPPHRLSRRLNPRHDAHRARGAIRRSCELTPRRRCPRAKLTPSPQLPTPRRTRRRRRRSHSVPRRQSRLRARLLFRRRLLFRSTKSSAPSTTSRSPITTSPSARRSSTKRSSTSYSANTTSFSA
jgi:hypothetical protein